MNGLNHLPDSSRVWIYQASAPLAPAAQQRIHHALQQFVQGWDAHGTSLSAGFDILHDQFIVLAVDEAKQNATGCSIDKSVHLMLELEKELKISLTDRKAVAYREENSIATTPMHEFWALRKAGRVTGSTVVFDNLVKTLGELKTEWEKPFEQSWHQTLWN